MLLAFIPFLPSQMEGRASVSLGDLNLLGSLLESCMVCFLADFWRNRHPPKLFEYPPSLTSQWTFPSFSSFLRNPVPASSRSSTSAELSAEGGEKSP